MRRVIYIDILICINLIVNYFLLLMTSRFIGLPLRRLRLVLGAGVGAIYSFYILLPRINIWLSFVIKILMSVTIVICAFKFMSIKMVIKATLCFLFISISFSGLMSMLWYSGFPKNLYVNNECIYINISPIVFIAYTLISYCIIKCINIVIGRQMPKKLMYHTYVEFKGKSVSFISKLDTGNVLKEPFSTLPVMIVEKRYIEKIIPKDLSNIIDHLNSSDLFEHGYRLVSFSTVSGTGVLPSFKPDKVIVDKNIKECYIAICPNRTLSSGICALIGTDFL